MSSCAKKKIIRYLSDSHATYTLESDDNGELVFCKYYIDKPKDCFKHLKEHRLICIEPGYYKDLMMDIDWCNSLEETENK